MVGWRFASPRKVFVACSAVAVAALLAWGPDSIWPILMLRAFAIPLAYAFAVMVVVLLWRKQWLLTACAATATVACCFIIASSVRVAALPSEEVRVLKLVQMNVLQTNAEQESATQAALTQDADVICVQEVDSVWTEHFLDALSAKYPYHCLVVRSDLYGVALFSRLPFSMDTVRMLGPLPAILATVNIGEVPVRLIAARLLAPESVEALRQRNTQWQQLTLWALEDPIPTAVFGDLNTVPWDNAFQAYCSSTGMIASVSSPAPTWPAFAGHGLVPLDHLLLSPALRQAHFHTFPIPGSDHIGFSALIGLAGK